MKRIQVKCERLVDVHVYNEIFCSPSLCGAKFQIHNLIVLKMDSYVLDTCR